MATRNRPSGSGRYRGNNRSSVIRQRDISKRVRDGGLVSAKDGYNNLIAKLGDDNTRASSAHYYTGNRLSGRWQELTAMYREGWLTKKIIDMPAEDMTKAWVSFDTQLEQDAIRAIEREMRQFRVQKKFTDALRWGRLYGGSIAIILIDGHEDIMDTPLDLVLVMPGTFRGLIIKDRWADVNPSLELVSDMLDPDYGFPMYYEVGDLGVNGTEKVRMNIHHSRVIRFVGRELPYAEEEAEMYWGASELEHIMDELNKRNATSANIAQLVFQANLRVLKMSDLGQILAMSDERTQKELYQTIQAQNMLMTSFGLQIMDSGDNFETHQYTFSGLNDIYQSFQNDIAGAAEIPATKLFGRSPDGMNSTGDSDLTNYYESIRQKQENFLRPAIEKLLPVVCVSVLGKVPDDIEVVFEPVESSTDTQRATLATQVLGTISSLFQTDLISKPMALKEMRKAAFMTGIGSVITDEDIDKAEEDAQLMAEQNAMGGGMGGLEQMMGGGGAEAGGAPKQPGGAAAPGGAPKMPPKAPAAPGQEKPAEDAVEPGPDDEKSVAIQSIREKIDSIEKLRKALYSLDGFDPNQPRDPDGKWGSGGSGGSSESSGKKTEKADEGWAKIAKAALGHNATENPKPPVPDHKTKSGWEQRSSGRNTVEKGFQRAQDRNDGRDLGIEHWGRHSFKYKGRLKSKEEYEEEGLKLLNSPVGGDIEGYVRKDGTIVRYNKVTNDYATGSYENGLITFFPPKHPNKAAGHKYFTDNRSREEHLWK